jgi:predicted ATP-binding protein involved in virulence
MKITKINIKNFRAFKDTEFKLNSNINVFVGINGVGKSTILDSLAISLSWLINRIQRSNASGRHISEQDISVNAKNASIKVSVQNQEKEYTWKLIKTLKGYSIKEKSDLRAASKLADYFQKAQQKEKSLPIIIYYPIDRNVHTTSPEIKNKTSLASVFDIYANALGGKTNFQTFFEWFRIQDDTFNEGIREHANKQIENLFKKLRPINYDEENTHDSKLKSELVKNFDSFIQNQISQSEELTSNQVRHLEFVKKAIEEFAPDYTNLRVKRSPQAQMLIDKEGVPLRLDQLSDGEKNLIALVGDIARRLSIANSQKENPLHGNGIVLIDEIDLHLHPNWQQMILPRFKEIFPNCQFIVSTHSPQILSHVEPQNIFLLKNEAKKGITYTKPSQSYGKSSDAILEDLMDVTSRPLKIQNDFRKLFQAIQESNLVEAKKMIKDLQNSMFGDDAELVKANVLIIRKEIIGK